MYHNSYSSGRVQGRVRRVGARVAGSQPPANLAGLVITSIGY
jgi:hypothetical protein